MTKPRQTSIDKFHADLKLQRHADAVMLALPKTGEVTQRDTFTVGALTFSERNAAINHLKEQGLVEGERNRLALTALGVETVTNNRNKAAPRTTYGQGTYTTPPMGHIRAGGLDHLKHASRGHRH